IAQSMVQALSDAQAQSLRWQAVWQEAPKDPMLWYHRALSETVDNAQKAFRLLEGHAQAVTKSAERLSTTAGQAGKGIQEAFTSVVTKMKEVYAAYAARLLAVGLALLEPLLERAQTVAQGRHFFPKLVGVGVRGRVTLRGLSRPRPARRHRSP